LARNAMLEKHEISLAESIAHRFSPERIKVVEIGSGCGGLALLLAHYGFGVRSYEGNDARHAAAKRHLVEQLKRHGELLGRVEFASGLVPEEFSRDILTNEQTNILVATNITHSYTAEHEDAIFRMAVVFDELIIDLSRFGVARNRAAERAVLLEALANSYFDPVEQLYFDDPYDYWWFRVRPILRQT
jgi:hypothetical protein